MKYIRDDEESKKILSTIFSNTKCVEIGDGKLFENDYIKSFKSNEYNYFFNKSNGYFLRWGKTKEDDPQFSLYGPEILDLELSTNGCPNNCKFCYKGNTNDPPTNMSLSTLKKIIDKVCPIHLIEITQDGKITNYNPNDIVNTTRGKIKAIELLETDTLIS